MIGEPEPAETAPAKLNKKNILEDLNFVNLDDIIDTSQEMQPQAVPEEEPDNALIDVIDIGLDFAEDLLRDMGYPAMKRNIWEQRGKKCMNKALNAYLPAGSGVGGALDTPLVALVIGVGALGLCLSPVIIHIIKTKRQEAEEEHAAELAAIPPPERMAPDAEPYPMETDGDGSQELDPSVIAAIMRANHQEFKNK